MRRVGGKSLVLVLASCVSWGRTGLVATRATLDRSSR